MGKFIKKKLRNISTRLKSLFYTSHFIHGDHDRLILGKRVALANTLFNTRSGRITVEDNVVFGHNVMVLTGIHDKEHPSKMGRRPTVLEAVNDIHIKHGAWIASGVIIIGPVVIGKDAVVGAGSVVVKDVPNGVFAAGNPARVVKKIDFKNENTNT